MKISRTDFKIFASPHFTEVSCPIHRNYMIELDNGWFGNPVWWCTECKKVYQLEVREVKKFDVKSVEQQLKVKEQLKKLK